MCFLVFFYICRHAHGCYWIHIYEMNKRQQIVTYLCFWLKIIVAGGFDQKISDDLSFFFFLKAKPFKSCADKFMHTFVRAALKQGIDYLISITGDS